MARACSVKFVLGISVAFDEGLWHDENDIEVLRVAPLILLTRGLDSKFHASCVCRSRRSTTCRQSWA